MASEMGEQRFGLATLALRVLGTSSESLWTKILKRINA